MAANHIRDTLRKKVELRWQKYRAEMLQCPAQEIFDQAEEIAIAQFCYDQLTGFLDIYPEDYLEYLLRFDDPFAVVRDQCLLEQSIDLSEEFDHVLWYLKDSGVAEQGYPLVPDDSLKCFGPTMC